MRLGRRRHGRLSPLGTCIANQASNSSIMFSGAFTCGGGGSDAGATAGGVVGGLAFFCCLAAICFVGVAKRYPRRARPASLNSNNIIQMGKA